MPAINYDMDIYVICFLKKLWLSSHVNTHTQTHTEAHTNIM